MTRYLFPVLLGVAGVAVLASLGVWQLQRLDWKESILAEIEARIAADPVSLPAAPDPEADRYMPVAVQGDLTGESLHVLASVQRVGPGHRLISVLELSDGRRIMVDEGFIREGGDLDPDGVRDVEVIGNLHWPDEVDRFTPEPEFSEDLFFARDVPVMAAHVGADPVLVVAREIEGTQPRAAMLPVTSNGIPNRQEWLLHPL